MNLTKKVILYILLSISAIIVFFLVMYAFAISFMSGVEVLQGKLLPERTTFQLFDTSYDFNKDPFKEAGIDPEKAPKTFTEIKGAVKKLTNYNMYGFSILTYGWFFEHLVATQGCLYVYNEDGRSGNEETSLFNGEEV